MPRGHRYHRRFMDIWVCSPFRTIRWCIIYTRPHIPPSSWSSCLSLTWHIIDENPRVHQRVCEQPVCARRHLEKSPLNFRRWLPAILSILTVVVANKCTYVKCPRRTERSSVFHFIARKQNQFSFVRQNFIEWCENRETYWFLISVGKCTIKRINPGSIIIICMNNYIVRIGF